ncbi:pyruvate dehydrogenase E2 component (dihydrolipoamide acetyltransferase) [Azospirillum agricola]|uniref:alpha/beta fold hydrolase n=1 Tax=Azospirillum agricola TaxID=1720247 RepID=UPI001AE926E0|nr:alpha/beta fold hydrolase [Azospirillum agricola]MBP2230503.1 pyruvate dehydrogenase E2 component (dihydrolipoamide acetyltransferase) [Azospirillum agricola]
MPRPVAGGGRLRGGVAGIEGGPASYLSAGSGGVPVLLLHGFAGDRLTWQFNLSALAADRRTVAVDLPGHGASTLDVGDGDVLSFVPWLIRFTDAIELPRFHIIGHSMGGYVGRELARRVPERVASLTLLASAGLGTPFDLGFLRHAIAPADAFEGRACAERLFARPSPLTGRIGEVLHAQGADPARRRVLERIIERSFAGHADGGPPVEWSGYRMPIQILWGREDRIIPLPPVERLPPGAPFHIFDNTGHLPHTEAASPVTAAIRAFLSSCDAPPDFR